MRGSIYHGVFLIDKPSGLTSHDVVHKMRKKMSIRAIGHAGTLDPMATGLLLIMVGEGTKLSNYLTGEEKTYEAEILLGQTTDSLDVTGQVTGKSDVLSSRQEVEAALKELHGPGSYAIPLFSAKKVNGEKLYEKAHRGEVVAASELPQKEMNFFDIQLQSFLSPSIKIRLTCSKGSFVRTFADELGRRLGCGACLSALRRIGSSPYNVNEAVPLDQFLEEWPNTKTHHFVPLASCLPFWGELKVTGRDASLVANGLIPNGMDSHILEIGRNREGVRIVHGETGDLLAILQKSGDSENHKVFKIQRVFKSLPVTRVDDSGQNT